MVLWIFLVFCCCLTYVALGQLHDVSCLICLQVVFIRFVRFGSAGFGSNRAVRRPVHVIIHNLLHNFFRAPRFDIQHFRFICFFFIIFCFFSTFKSFIPQLIRHLKQMTYGMLAGFIKFNRVYLALPHLPPSQRMLECEIPCRGRIQTLYSYLIT